MDSKRPIVNYSILFRMSVSLLVLYQFFLYGFVDRLWSHVWAERLRFLVVCSVLFLLFKRFAQRLGMSPAKNRIISCAILIVMALLLLTSELVPINLFGI